MRSATPPVTSGSQSTVACKLSDIKRLRELEDESQRLKQMSADLLLENRALKDVIAKKL